MTTREDVERLAQERDEKAMESRAWAEAHIDGGRPEHAQGWLLAAQHAEATAAMLRALLDERDAARAEAARLLEAAAAMDAGLAEFWPTRPREPGDAMHIAAIDLPWAKLRAALAAEARDE